MIEFAKTKHVNQFQNTQLFHEGAGEGNSIQLDKEIIQSIDQSIQNNDGETSQALKCSRVPSNMMMDPNVIEKEEHTLESCMNDIPIFAIEDLKGEEVLPLLSCRLKEISSTAGLLNPSSSKNKSHKDKMNFKYKSSLNK